MSAIDLLLDIEMRSAAISIGLNAHSADDLITEDNLYNIINEVEISLLKGTETKAISTICALLWTHFGDKFDLLGEYIYSVMSRIGFSPVAGMLKNTKHNLILASSSIPMIESELKGLSHSVKAFNQTYKLTEFQKRLWDALELSDSVAISAPTSAGKSFLICLSAVLGASKRGGISLYIVPTLTLMNQVASDLLSISQKHKFNLSIETHLSNFENIKSPTFYVVTQERITEYTELLAKGGVSINYLIVDEVQNIERAFSLDNDDTRAKILLDVIIEVHDQCKPQKTIVAGPRISEIQQLSESLFRKNCTAISTTTSPVINISYIIHPYSNKIELRQYTELKKQANSSVYENSIGATGFGKTSYDEKFHKYLGNILSNNQGSLVFSPTAPQCRKTALYLSENAPEIENETLHKLADYIKTTVSPKYDLARCVEKGIAFHHGKMPHHIRNAIEFAISKSMFKQVVCTTTLMQGVNIPAKNVVIRNPNLFVTRRDSEKPQLSNYEIANLRGRAGRLMRDFIGRTYILDGTSFEAREVQSSLFEPAQKSLDGSYSKIFSEKRDEIVGHLLNDENYTKSNSLSNYISSVLYTEPNAQQILERKGIIFAKSEIKAINEEQKSLSVSKEVCKKFRYWSPFEMELIKTTEKSFSLPATLYTSDGASNLYAALCYMRDLLPHQYQKHMGKSNTKDNKVWVIAIHAIKWANETPLSDLLAEPYPMKNSDNTDSTINMLQQTVSYGLPSLLGPLFSLTAPRSTFLASVEYGAYRNASQLLINHNIPREIAIRISRFAEQKRVNIGSIEDAISFLKQAKMLYWNAIQFRHITSISDLVR